MNRFRQLFVSTVLNSITMMKSSEMDRAQNAVKELIRQIQWVLLLAVQFAGEK
jgi:hypothetical protein